MGKPVERQNHSLSFFLLATLIALSTGWAFYAEFLGRRPWKGFQEQIFQYDKEKSESDIAYLQRKLDSGDTKVIPDPAKPDQAITLAEAKNRLAALDAEVGREREVVGKLQNDLHEAKIHADDADVVGKYLRSEDDGLFYLESHSTHEGELARTAAGQLQKDGKTEEAKAELEKAAEWDKELAEVKAERAEKKKAIAAADVDAAAKLAAYQAVQKQYDDKVGQQTALKTAIDAATDSLNTAKTTAEKAATKGTELTQYWLTTYDNSVDRCQNCHASIDKCGYSRPSEVLEALAAPDAKPEEVVQKYCLNPDQVDAFKQTASDVCALELDAAASQAGESKDGVCFDDANALDEFFVNYCGPTAPALKGLEEGGFKKACFAGGGGKTLASYVQDPKEIGACNLELKDQGDTCVEGAKRDQLLWWLRKHCSETSSTVAALDKLPKACASGDAGKKLGSVKPVVYDYPLWAQAHPYRAELLGNNHPADKLGCTSCHEGQGAQTKGVQFRDFHHGWDDPYWDKPLLDLVAHKHYRPDTWGAPLAEGGVPGVWKKHEKEFRESSCAKCHADEVHLKFADTYTQGRRLVAEIGCHGCHPVDVFTDFPRIGPKLTDLRMKTTPEFLLTWVSYPKSFRPRTKMPNFWPEALDVKLQPRVGSAEWRKRDTEVQEIVAYLWKSAPEESLPAVPLAGNAERGAVLVGTVGCRGCHTFGPADKLCSQEQCDKGKARGTPQSPAECESPRPLSGSAARDFAPNLSNIGYKTNERWLYAWVKNPTAMWAGTRMPNLRLSDQEAADIAAFLMTRKNGSAPTTKLAFNVGTVEFDRAAQEGSKLITKYGCPGCHEIRGHENDSKIGADLSDFGRKAVDLLDFGDAIPNPRHYSWYNWTDLKLRAPRSYQYERVETRMPQFDLNEDEVRAIMVFLRSRTGDKVPHRYMVAGNDRLERMAMGDQVVEYYNCRGCHVVEGNGGLVRNDYPEDDIYKAPPLLQKEGWRTQPEWLFGFINDPSNKLRPWLDIRMPTFPLGDVKRTTVVSYFSAVSDVPYPYVTVDVKADQKELAEAKTMIDKQLNCFKCHTKGAPPPDADRASLAPNLELAKHRLRPDWVVAWLKNPQLLQDGTRMPSFFTPDNFETVMYPDYFGGKQLQQIEALKDYVMTLPDEAAVVAKKPTARR
jgi:cytochrome c2